MRIWIAALAIAFSFVQPAAWSPAWSPAFSQARAQDTPAPRERDKAIQQEPGSNTPDPTVRTVDQLRREISALRDVLDTRITAIEKATDIRTRILDAIPELIEKNVENLRKLHEEKFASIGTQFKERDTRLDQALLNLKGSLEALLLAAEKAVSTALTASKEAVAEQNRSNAAAANKSEFNFTKLIDQTSQLLSTVQRSLEEKITANQKTLDDKIATALTRVTTIESLSKGGSDTWAFIAIAISMMVGVISIFSFLTRPAPPVRVVHTNGSPGSG